MTEACWAGAGSTLPASLKPWANLPDNGSAREDSGTPVEELLLGVAGLEPLQTPVDR